MLYKHGSHPPMMCGRTGELHGEGSSAREPLGEAAHSEELVRIFLPIIESTLAGGRLCFHVAVCLGNARIKRLLVCVGCAPQAGKHGAWERKDK